MNEENVLSRKILDAAFKVHTTLGPGIFESVYESLLCYELSKMNIATERQVTVPVRYDGLLFDEGFRADVIVGGIVLVELKSIEKLAEVHKKQTLTYLKLTGLRLGLLINFGSAQLKDGIVRIANGLSD